jgi:epoxyqueuosine reductase
MTQDINLPEGLEIKIKAEAYRLGFSLAGITTPAPLEGYPFYEQWLKDGQNADMSYMTTMYHRESRKDPRRLMPGVRSIICLGYSYPIQPLERTLRDNIALVAGYTTGVDYHTTLHNKLESLAEFIQSVCSRSITYKTFTDSAPILERELASRAGMGWIGKNSCLISPLIGSGILLAELFIDLDLIPDQPFNNDYCGSCQRCLQACPTSCILKNRTIDSNRCISYHTIENRQSIPAGIAEKMGNWLFGCDICQMVCPWNKKNLAINTETEFSVKQLVGLLEMDSATFSSNFRHSSLLRAKQSGLVRNSLIVLANMNASDSISAINKFLESCQDSVITSTARWALDSIQKNTPL